MNQIGTQNNPEAISWAYLLGSTISTGYHYMKADEFVQKVRGLPAEDVLSAFMTCMCVKLKLAKLQLLTASDLLLFVNAVAFELEGCFAPDPNDPDIALEIQTMLEALDARTPT